MKACGECSRPTDREQELRKLAESAVALVDFPRNGDVYAFVCDRVKRFVGPGIVGVSEIDLDRSILTTRRVLGLTRTGEAAINKMIGKNRNQLSFDGVNDDAKKGLATCRLMKLDGGLYQMCFGRVPRVVCTRLEAILGVESVYSIGLKRENAVFGNVTILANEKSVINPYVIETFVNMASVVLANRKHAERRRLIDAQLRQSQKLASIGTLAGGVAHEINNPINGIMNYAQLIRDYLGARPPESLVEYAEEIIRETERVATVVRNLLRFARVTEVERSATRIEDIVDSTLSLVKTVVRHDRIILKVDVPLGLPPIECCSQQIQQVLMNLVINARDSLNQKYAGYGGKKIIEVTARSFERDQQLWDEITVRDNGLGITAEVREQMFDPFYTTKPRTENSGLGLAIIHGIVAKHGGEIRVDSTPGEGAAFHVCLPTLAGGDTLSATMPVDS